MKILMVCLGNICRSPLAQGIMEAKVLESKLDWEVDSAGTSAYHVGEKPDPRSISTAADNGIDITSQRARQFSKLDFKQFDIIYAMDKSNYHDIIQHADSENSRKKVKLILNEAFPGENRDVPDPYWNDRFPEVYEMLEKSCDEIISKYKNQ
ncbi:MAG: low molecular weight phosphotyrosine protein phosphatase [Saprospirales bacterium]|nr:MAG: low molecular weight phosphotyrosine protein phosphatase [Saprospirales bacterium]